MPDPAEASAQKTTLCLGCRATFTDAEIETARSCPKCGSVGVPADLRKAHTLTLTDHEWRVLFMWAENWSRHVAEAHPEMRGTIRGIRAEAMRQQPAMPALSLFGEVQALADALGVKAEITDSNGVRTVVDPAVRH